MKQVRVEDVLHATSVTCRRAKPSDDLPIAATAAGSNGAVSGQTSK